MGEVAQVERCEQLVVRDNRLLFAHVILDRRLMAPHFAFPFGPLRVLERAKTILFLFPSLLNSGQESGPRTHETGRPD